MLDSKLEIFVNEVHVSNKAIKEWILKFPRREIGFGNVSFEQFKYGQTNSQVPSQDLKKHQLLIITITC